MWYIRRPKHWVNCCSKEDPGKTNGKHEQSCEGDLTDIQPDENNDNGIPFHHYTTGHAFLFNQTKILAWEKNAFRRKVIEGIHIANKKNSCVNIIAGKKIENIWMPLVQDLRLS